MKKLKSLELFQKGSGWSTLRSGAAIIAGNIRRPIFTTGTRWKTGTQDADRSRIYRLKRTTKKKKPNVRIALAQINARLGDFKFNFEKILSFTAGAKERRCDLVMFPEAALFGYHPVDLLERISVVEEQMKYLNRLSREIPKGMSVLVGAIVPNGSGRGK